MAGYRCHLIAHVFVRRQEALLGPVMEVQQQNDSQPRAVKG